MPPKELIIWTCPDCGTENVDLQDDYTHCANCGEVVWVLNDLELFIDQNWKVDVSETEAET